MSSHYQPTRLELDLITTVARICQIARQTLEDPLSVHLFEDRLLTCDVPRLLGYLSPQARAWADETEPGWDRAESVARHPSAWTVAPHSIDHYGDCRYCGEANPAEGSECQARPRL